MKLRIILSLLCAATTQLMAASVQETNINLTIGAPTSGQASTSYDAGTGWNTLTAKSGSATDWPAGTSISGMQLKDTAGNDSYTLTFTKTGAAGIFKYSDYAAPSLGDHSAGEPYNTSGIGGNNTTGLTFTLSGFQSGDVLNSLVFGGMVINNKFKNDYKITITGATWGAGSTSDIALSDPTNVGTPTWSGKTEGSSTQSLTLVPTGTENGTGFTVELKDLVMTGSELTISITSPTAATSGGSKVALDYISIIPEPATASLSLLSLGLLSLRRRRS